MGLVKNAYFQFYSHLILLQRQLTMRPIKIQPSGNSLQGFWNWFSWKIVFATYILSAGLPVIGYMACLFVIAIKREATILISMIMMMMINPVITLSIGVFAKTVGKFSSKSFPPLNKFNILSRLFTYSINCHFAMIASMTMYMYKMWINLEKRAEFAFSDNSFDKCTCDVLNEIGQDCSNRETGYSFQNLFLLVDMQKLLFAFLVISMICHLIQSIFLNIPVPIPLFQFIVGKDDENGKTVSEFKLENVNVEPDTKHTKSKAFNGFITKRFKVSWCMIAMTFLIGLVGVPFYGFDQLPGESISAKNGKTKTKFCYEILKEKHSIPGTDCLTIDHYPCKFPFWYAGKVHYRCTNSTRSDLPHGSQWCAIDSKILRFKSIGICSESCLRSKHFSCLGRAGPCPRVNFGPNRPKGNWPKLALGRIFMAQAQPKTL